MIVGASVLLIAKEPDLGTAIIAAVSSAASSSWRAFGRAPWRRSRIVIAVIGLGMIATHPYQEARLTGFLHPEQRHERRRLPGASRRRSRSDPAGIFGVGLGESVQKASYLPEAHTDMVAAVIGEELGLVGMFVLIGLFGMFGYAGLRAAHRARDRFSKLLAAGSPR